MARAASSAIAFTGLCVGISVAALLPFSQSPPGAVNGAQAAQLGPAAHMMLAGVASFFTAITIIYAHLHSGRGSWKIPEVTFLFLCASVGLMELSFCMQLQPGPVPVQAPVLPRAAVELLPHAGAATFYLSLVLAYVHVHAAGGARNDRYTAALKLLNTMAFAATLITGVFSSITDAFLRLQHQVNFLNFYCYMC